MARARTSQEEEGLASWEKWRPAETPLSWRCHYVRITTNHAAGSALGDVGLKYSWTEESLSIPITLKAKTRALINHEMKTLKQVQERPQYAPPPLPSARAFRMAGENIYGFSFIDMILYPLPPSYTSKLKSSYINGF